MYIHFLKHIICSVCKQYIFKFESTYNDNCKFEKKFQMSIAIGNYGEGRGDWEGGGGQMSRPLSIF